MAGPPEAADDVVGRRPPGSRWRVLPEPVRWADTTTTQPVGSCWLVVGCAGGADGASLGTDLGDGD